MGCVKRGALLDAVAQDERTGPEPVDVQAPLVRHVPEVHLQLVDVELVLKVLTAGDLVAADLAVGDRGT